MSLNEDSDFLTSLKQRRISIIVPVYNQGIDIKKNLDLLISQIEPYFLNYEVLVISDGSTDATNQELKSYSHPFVRSIFLFQNQGKGYAVRKGFTEAQGDFFLFIDGGMELHPREIRIFLGLLVLYDADVVIGSKRHPQSQVEYPWFRVILSLIYQQLIRFFFDLNVTDTQVGLKIFKRAVIEAIKDDLSIDRYGFDLELLALARLRGYRKMLEAPVSLDYFSKNQRNMSSEFFHVLHVGFQITVDTLRVYFKIRKLRLSLKNG